MNTPRNLKKILFLIGGVFFILAVTLGSWLFIKNLIDKRRGEKFSDVLNETVNLIEDGLLTEAEILLDSLSDYPETSVEYLRILKQYHSLCESLGDYSGFLKLAEKASADFPGREDIRALEIWALLRTGDYEKARVKAMGLKDKKYESFKAETLLSLSEQLTEQLVTGNELDSNPHLKVVFSDDPGLFIHAGEATGVEEYFLDGMLLYAGEGRFGPAESIFRKYMGENYPEIGLYLAFDRGRLQTAKRYLDVLDNREELTEHQRLLSGDILFREKKYSEAADFYEMYIRDYPSISWLSYSNYFAIKNDYISGNEIYDSIEILEKGINNFPESLELNMLYARVLLENGDYEAAEEVLQKVTGINENDYKAEAALIRLMRGRRSPEYITGRYWELVNKYPDNSDIVKEYARYLMSWSREEEFYTLMEKYEAGTGVSPWTFEYRGIFSALKGDFKTAGELLLKSLALNENMEILYNLAVVCEKDIDYTRAEDYLVRALKLAEKGSKDESTGRIRIRLGIVLYKNMKFEKAAYQIKEGLKLLPDDLEGILYLRLINRED